MARALRITTLASETAAAEAVATSIEHLPLPPADRWPDVLGAVHERLLAREHRHRRGVYYTASRIAERVVDITFEAAEPTGLPTVCDPSCGGGAFLLAAARRLEGFGVPPATAVETCVWGIDIDPLAAAVADAALHLWSAERGSPAARAHVSVGDSLTGEIEDWGEVPNGFDVVVGNPPFQSQLGASTARSGPETDRLRDRLGASVHGYADTAALFLVQAVRMTQPGGQVSLLLPQSFLTARDATGVRRDVVADADLVGLWYCRERLFDAGVRVCAPVLRKRDPSAPRTRPELRRYLGAELEPVTARAWGPGEPEVLRTWSPLLSDLLDVPPVDLTHEGTMHDLAQATAGFRDQYYGLVGRVEEAGPADPASDRAERDDRPTCRLVTVGLIDPGRCTWGLRATRFGGQPWRAPLVRLDELDESLRAWAEPLLRPKVVVATQTKVLEAAVDEQGDWYPSVPLIALIPNDPAMVWHVLAVVLAPPVSAWAWQHHAGAALSADTLKLAARDVLGIPVPRRGAAWDRAADAARSLAGATDEEQWRGILERLGAAMCEAYAVDAEDVLRWWSVRLPRWVARPDVGRA